MTLKPSIKEALKEGPAKSSAKKLKEICLCVTKKGAEEVPFMIIASNV
jgi:hypothetical protein